MHYPQFHRRRTPTAISERNAYLKIDTVVYSSCTVHEHYCAHIQLSILYFYIMIMFSILLKSVSTRYILRQNNIRSIIIADNQ